MLIPFASHAQLSITGTVLDKEGNNVVEAANVMIKSSSGKIIGFSTTDQNGEFNIIISKSEDGITINVTALGFKPFTDKLTPESSPLEIKLEYGSNRLEEVVVKSDKIRAKGDTIVYNVSSFSREQDKTIGDVIKRMPGLSVEENGTIKYQGASINKFYIEGQDLLGGKYGIATNGISHQDIGAVEIMENHQPKQVLRGISFSDQAGLNLRLKNKSKATILAHGNIGGGWSNQPKGMLWIGDIFSMLVAGKYQMITLFKGNNIGHNQSAELSNLYSRDASEKLSRYTSIAAPSTPNLQRNRSFFNHSWMVSSSQLWKTRADSELKTQIDYSYDRTLAQGHSTTTYFLDSGDKVILEDRKLRNNKNALSAMLAFETNEKTYYLNNNFTTNITWNDRTLETTGTMPNTQSAFRPEFYLGNNLQFIKRFGNKIIFFNSINEWNSMPERLSVISGDRKYGQKIGQHAFYTDEDVSLGFLFKRVMFSLKAGITGYIRNLKTDLWGFTDPNSPADGKVTTDYLRVYASPKLEWNFNRLDLTIDIPFLLYNYFFSKGIKNRTELFISPAMNTRFKLAPNMFLSLRASAKRTPAQLHNIHNTAVMTNYRTFSTGADNYYASTGKIISLGYGYRNHYGLFLNASVTHVWNNSKIGTIQDIAGDYVFYAYTSQPAKSKSFITYGALNKTIEFINGAAGISVNYNTRDNNILSQGKNTKYNGESLTLTSFVSGGKGAFFNWDLKFSWNREMLKVADIKSVATNNFLYKGSFTLSPFSRLNWSVGGEFYRSEVVKKNFKNMFMLDTKLAYTLSRRVEISASLNNILNKKFYSYTSYGAISSFEQSSMLRGREFLISIYLKK